ncbi:hypothetical protein PR202_gb19281 [Eleusine coracana subsp. coracana]|uniref:Uncharacterized protein n=1 Tax=Eleusine coracana subsp. coracana TaxID=191504 RepID=A0AAV5F7U4_ELECO|nr:hypothetical protein PR202_gb19281 [Eleusine coracana subsp. coracana]
MLAATRKVPGKKLGLPAVTAAAPNGGGGKKSSSGGEKRPGDGGEKIGRGYVKSSGGGGEKIGRGCVKSCGGGEFQQLVPKRRNGGNEELRAPCDISFPDANNLLCSWEEDIVGLVEKKHGNRKVLLSFECETLKADKDAEEHITKYMPNLCGLDAVVNVGKMSISGINLDEEDEPKGDN